MMRTHLISIVVAALICALLLTGIALAQSGSGSGPAAWYLVEQGIASGGGYRLTGAAWKLSGAANGGGYQLLGPAAPALRGNGCCCTYLPCIVRGW